MIKDNPFKEVARKVVKQDLLQIENRYDSTVGIGDCHDAHAILKIFQTYGKERLRLANIGAITSEQAIMDIKKANRLMTKTFNLLNN